MYFGDHAPPHFHASYGEHEAIIQIQTLTVLDGQLPPRALGLVAEWASIHREELLLDWDRAVNMRELAKIDPLP